ncbi:MAG: flagellar motor switch protein FliN [Fidelibacterota bacterium]
MNSESFKSIFTEFFTKRSDDIIGRLREAYKQEFSLNYTLPENSDQILESMSAELPLVAVHFRTTDGSAQHVIGLSLGTVARLLAWASGKQPKEDLEEEDMDIFSGQVVSILESLPDLNLGQPKMKFIESAEQFVTEAESAYAVYDLINGEETLKIFHAIRGRELEKETGKENVSVHPASFGQVPDSPVTNGPTQNMDMLLDVELRVFVELGQKSMLINDILKLGKGSVIELEKAAGEPLDIFVNDKKFALGEVVVVDDRFGIRITKLAGLTHKLGSMAG